MPAHVTSLARTHDPRSSVQAGAAVERSNAATAQKAAIIALLREQPMTDRALTTRYMAVAVERGYPGTEPDSVRKRRSDLTRASIVVFDHFEQNGRGRDIAVWKVRPDYKPAAR